MSEYRQVRRKINKGIKLKENLVGRKKSDEEKELDRRSSQLESIILGHPESFARVRCWMVDAVGKEKIGKKDAKGFLRAIIEDSHSAVDRVGDLAARVREVMEQFSLTDSGAGSVGWHLGCHCTQNEAERLVFMLHLRFPDEIESGALEIRRMPWSLDLVGKAP